MRNKARACDGAAEKDGGLRVLERGQRETERKMEMRRQDGIGHPEREGGSFISAWVTYLENDICCLTASVSLPVKRDGVGLGFSSSYF